MSYHHFEIRPDEPDRLLSGPHAVLLMDGKPLRGVLSLTLELGEKDLAVLTLRVVGKIKVDGVIKTKIEGLPQPEEARPPRVLVEQPDGSVITREPKITVEQPT